MRELAALNQRYETMRSAGDFISIAKCLLKSTEPGLRGALQWARQSGCNARVVAALEQRAAAPIGQLGPGSVWGSELADYKIALAGFAASLSSVGVFDAMLQGGMKVVPLSSIVGSVTAAVQGFIVGESSAKQISKLALANSRLEPIKAHAIIILTSELLRFAQADALLGAELRRAVTLATDVEFLSEITSGVSVATSVGSTPISVRNDLAALAAAVPSDQTSRLFIVTTPTIVKTWALMGSTSGNATSAFSDLTVQGGTVSGMQVIPSDAVTAGQVILVDASGIAAGSGDIVLDNMRQASLQMDSAPDSPTSGTTNLISLWQTNQVGLRIERWWGCEKLRGSAVAICSNSNNYQSGFSPP